MRCRESSLNDVSEESGQEWRNSRVEERLEELNAVTKHQSIPILTNSLVSIDSHLDSALLTKGQALTEVAVGGFMRLCMHLHVGPGTLQACLSLSAASLRSWIFL